MNDSDWGREYLEEARCLKQHLAPLHGELKHVSGEAGILLYRRISMLNAMYLECLHIGRYLTGKEDCGEKRFRFKP